MSLEKAVRIANALPQTDDLQLLKVISPQIHAANSALAARLLRSITAVDHQYFNTSKESDTHSFSSTSSASFSPPDSPYLHANHITDHALELFNAALDITRGIEKTIVPPKGPLGPASRHFNIPVALAKRQPTFLDIEKPQLHFEDYPIDNSNNPFVSPYAIHHPQHPANQQTNASMPSAHLDSYLQDLYKKNSNHISASARKHPYDDDITAATIHMSQVPFHHKNTIVYSPVEDTSCTIIHTEEQLFNMAELLKRSKEIAVDLENHSIRSFQGFICLVQISTRRHDFIIDALKLRSSLHRALASIFADDTIVKVLHGADKDVQWLERDFGIYIVNMFDTGQASRLLKLPSAALSFLLSHFCNLKGLSKKKYQLADWRQRPLPDDMLEYARSDTHYLLYIYDRLRSELTKNNLLAKAWERSAVVCRKRYSKIQYDPSLGRHLAARHGLGFDPHQMRLMEELCRWRDITAREQDESLPYVAPLNTLIGIVRARDKARTIPGLLKFGFPSQIVPPLVEKNAEELTRLICDALEARLEDCPPVAKEEKASKEIRKPVSAKEETFLTSDVETDCNATEVESRAGLKHSSNTSQKKVDDSGKCNPAYAPGIVLVKERRKSAFFDSDSDSDSSIGEMPLPQAPAKSCSAPAEAVESQQDKSDVSMLKSVSEEENGTKDLTEGVEVSNSDDDVACSKATLAGRSVFDLSESSDEENMEDGCGADKKKADEVISRMKAELAEKQKNAMPDEFRVETDAVEEREVHVEAVALDSDGKAVEEKEEIVSLLDAAKSGSKQSRKRRRKERKTKEDAPRVDAFDYATALREDKQRKKSGKEGFDPMQKLRVDWQAKGGRGGQDGSREDGGKNRFGRAKRRRRGGCKSMSFVGR